MSVPEVCSHEIVCDLKICLLCIAPNGYQCNFFLCVLTLFNYFLILSVFCVMLSFVGETKMYLICITTPKSVIPRHSAANAR